MPMLIFWRSFTGLFAGAMILVQASPFFSRFTCSVIGDLVPAEERSVFLSRLDACSSASFILGPAIGGVLGQVSYHFPLCVSVHLFTHSIIGGIASGIAFIVALFLLKESNPAVIQRREAKKVGITCALSCIPSPVVEENEKKVKPINRAKVHISGTMCLCFAFEFCVRWTTNAYESRYGIYLNDLFGTSSMRYS